MTNALDPLVCDLVEWIAQEPRDYADVLDAWRTSCPRLTVWEDAVDRGLVERRPAEGRGMRVVATAAGRAFVNAHRCASREMSTAVLNTVPAAQTGGTPCSFSGAPSNA